MIVARGNAREPQCFHGVGFLCVSLFKASEECCNPRACRKVHQLPPSVATKLCTEWNSPQGCRRVPCKGLHLSPEEEVLFLRQYLMERAKACPKCKAEGRQAAEAAKKRGPTTESSTTTAPGKTPVKKAEADGAGPPKQNPSAKTTSTESVPASQAKTKASDKKEPESKTTTSEAAASTQAKAPGNKEGAKESTSKPEPKTPTSEAAGSSQPKAETPDKKEGAKQGVAGAQQGIPKPAPEESETKGPGPSPKASCPASAQQTSPTSTTQCTHYPAPKGREFESRL